MTFFGSSNPVADFEAHDIQQAAALAALPVCDFCGKPIQDAHYYEIGSETVCRSCLDMHFRKDVD